MPRKVSAATRVLRTEPSYLIQDACQGICTSERSIPWPEYRQRIDTSPSLERCFTHTNRSPQPSWSPGPIRSWKLGQISCSCRALSKLALPSKPQRGLSVQPKCQFRLAPAVKVPLLILCLENRAFPRSFFLKSRSTSGLFLSC